MTPSNLSHPSSTPPAPCLYSRVRLTPGQASIWSSTSKCLLLLGLPRPTFFTSISPSPTQPLLLRRLLREHGLEAVDYDFSVMRPAHLHPQLPSSLAEAFAWMRADSRAIACNLTCDQCLNLWAESALDTEAG